jgi:hypothetical protein
VVSPFGSSAMVPVTASVVASSSTVALVSTSSANAEPVPVASAFNTVPAPSAKR